MFMYVKQNTRLTAERIYFSTELKLSSHISAGNVLRRRQNV